MHQQLLKNDKYEIWGETGWERFDGIIKSIDDSIPLLDIECENGAKISCTYEHKISSNNEYIESKKLSIGDKIVTEIGDNEICKIQERNVNEVYDIWNSKSHHVFSQIDGNAMVLSAQCDEFAFVPGNQAEEFWAANYPTISASKQAKIIIISTPNGLFNIFHRIYSQAEANQNTFHANKVIWSQVPGRDETWAEEQLKNLGKIKFAQEFNCEFVGSTNTLIDVECLKTLLSLNVEPIKYELSNKLLIYEEPKKGAIYILGVDPAKGTGENWSTIQVLKLISIKPIKLEQVAVFRNNLTDIYDFSDIINRLSYYYNHGYIMIENNGEGSAVVQRLWWDLENENLVNSGSKDKNLGIRSTTKTKPKAVLLMKKLIEDGSLKLVDKETIEELGSFIEENNKFFGKDKPDDLVSALYWGCYILEMNILDEKYEFIEKIDDDIWGILSEIEEMVEDWNWLTETSFRD